MPDWMAFNVSDYTANTLHLTTRQHGGYILLICAAWAGKGVLPGADASLMAIAKLSPKEWAADAEIIKAFLTRRGETWVHERVEYEWLDAQALIKAKSAAGKEGARRRWAGRSNGKPMAAPSPSHGKPMAAPSVCHWQTDAPVPLPTTHYPLTIKDKKDSEAAAAPSASPRAPGIEPPADSLEFPPQTREIGPWDPARPLGAEGGRPRLENDCRPPGNLGVCPSGESDGFHRRAPDAPRAAMASREETDVAFALWMPVAYELRIPEPMFMNPARRDALRARLAECGGIEGWKLALERLREAKFLRDDDDPSKPKHWVNLATLCKPENFTGLMEGRYADRLDSAGHGPRGTAAAALGIDEA